MKRIKLQSKNFKRVDNYNIHTLSGGREFKEIVAEDETSPMHIIDSSLYDSGRLYQYLLNSY